MFSANSSQVSSDRLYVEDVFSTWLYTATTSNQTITNGIDISGKGGLIWQKARNAVDAHYLWDTSNGTDYYLRTNSTSAREGPYSGITFNNNGFTNKFFLTSGQDIASWTFREAPKFFDVVTFTSNSAAGASFSHSLGSSPGMVIIKCTSQSQVWFVWHRGISTDKLLYLNTTDAQQNVGVPWISVSDTNVTIIDGMLSNTQTYVAYLFAHDATSDGIIQCGSFTHTNGSSTNVSLGWEPQWLLMKRSDAVNNWVLLDNMRGMPVDGADAYLYANTSGAEASTTFVDPSATGFATQTSLNSGTYIYIAIRRGPMRTPTSGTSVFAPSTAGATTDITVGFPADTYWIGRDDANWRVFDRLRSGFELATNTTGAEGTFNYAPTYIHWDSNSVWNQNLQSSPLINYFFRRAPSFFDVVCYTGTGVARTVNHNLGVAPELMIVKIRNGSLYAWLVYSSTSLSGNTVQLNKSDAAFPDNGVFWTTTAPTSTVFSLNDNALNNEAGKNFVAYLFASCPGVSKVGSYTGNGSSQTINCGFAAGARFVMIKRTDSTGDWYVWDSASGIVSGNDPHRSLNTTAARVTTDDSVDTDSSGFVVNQLSATNINVSSATYIYLAVA